MPRKSVSARKEEPEERCPTCLAPLPRGRMDGVCPACFLAVAGGWLEGDGDRGLQIPGLRVGEELARGGMGIVYAAEQVEPRRTVALKVLRPQWSDHASVRERFRREAQAMAGLEHEAILPVYAVGEVDGLPWFTMKLAVGGSLATRVVEYRGRWAAVAELTEGLADALHFAHTRGVLHRDLKPGNVLFDAGGRACLADFGLAKDVEDGDEAITQHADVLGTPQYLAPELAGGRARSATIASDVYGLGAVLYELLSGRPPHAAGSLPELLRRVSDEAPAPLTRLDPPPPRDLRAICEMAMAGEPGRRYASAGEMAEDLRLFRRGLPVRAREPGRWESAVRWCRRHPLVAGLLGMVGVLVGALAVSLAAANQGREEAESNLRRSLLVQAEAVRLARLARFPARALEHVQAAASPGESAAVRADRRSQAVAALAYPTLILHPLPRLEEGWDLAAIAHGHTYFAWSRSDDSEFRVTRARDGLEVGRGKAPGKPVALSRDGRWMALQRDEAWELWGMAGPEAGVVRRGTGRVEDLSDDGTLMAVHHSEGTSGRWAEVRETESGRVRFRLGYPMVSLKMRFDPAGGACAVAPSFYLNHTNFPYSVRVHDCADGRLRRELSSGLANCVWSMAWSRDGRLLGASERGGAAFVWDAVNGNPVQVMRGLGANLWRMAFSEDRRYLATLGDDRMLTVYELSSGAAVARAQSERYERFTGLVWSADEPEVFGPVRTDGVATFLQLRPGAYESFRAPEGHGSALGIAVAPGGEWLAVGDSRHARLWNIGGEHPWLAHTFAEGLWNSFVFSPDGRWLYGCGEPGVLRWGRDAGGHVVGPGVPLARDGMHHEVSLDARGMVLAAESSGSRVNVVFGSPASDAPTSITVPNDQDDWVALSPDGSRLVTAGGGGLRMWRVSDGAPVRSESRPSHWAGFSPDGRWLLAAMEGARGEGIRYEIWSVEDWRMLRVLPSRSLTRGVARGCWLPDGGWLVTGHPLGRMAVWDTSTWEMRMILESPNGQPVGRMAYDATRRRLFSASAGGVVEVWDLARLESELRIRELGW